MKNNKKEKILKSEIGFAINSKIALWLRLGTLLSVLYLLYFFVFFTLIASSGNTNIVLTFLAIMPGVYLSSFITSSFLYLICFIIANTAFYFLIGSLIGLLIKKIKNRSKK